MWSRVILSLVVSSLSVSLISTGLKTILLPPAVYSLETFVDHHPPQVLTSPTNQSPRTTNSRSSDLVFPDLQTLPPANLRLFHDSHAGRTLLRFTNSIFNSGPGKLELIGTPTQTGDMIRVFQRVYTADPEIFEEFEIGEFKFHDQHNHWHLEKFASYEVWSVDEQGALENLASSGGKVSYCVMDISLGDLDLADGEISPYRSYTHCQGNRQGLSVGWVDTYKYFYPGQWVEVSSLEDGIYALVSTVNPDRLIYEENTYNNQAVVYFELRELSLNLLGYPLFEKEGGHIPK